MTIQEIEQLETPKFIQQIQSNLKPLEFLARKIECLYLWMAI